MCVFFSLFLIVVVVVVVGSIFSVFLTKNDIILKMKLLKK